MARKKWTEQEISYIDKFYEKRGVPYLAKKLKRTEASVKHKAQSLGHNAYAPEDLYTRTLAKCFHCDSRVIIRWMDKYGLKYYSVQRGKASCKLIEVKEFWKWAENHKDLIPWNKYEPLSVLPEPSWLKDVLKNYDKKRQRNRITPIEVAFVVNYKKKGYTYKEIAAKLERSVYAAKHIWLEYKKKKMEELKVTNQKVGAIVESLISIRDMNKDLSEEDRDTIANACNILSHTFNFYDNADTIVNDKVVNIFWRIEDIENALQKAGFSSCEDNVESIMNHVYFKKSLEENSISKGWDIIEDTISELKDSLIQEEVEEDNE